jgi:UTP:GlnB (protein PII) uridylyltransferase
MLERKAELEIIMRQRLQAMRGADADGIVAHSQYQSDENSSSSSRRKEGANELRNRRRAQLSQAVIEDLCSVVADLFIAESKLLKPLNYGMSENYSSPSKRDAIAGSVRSFLSLLPMRYALGADTPSEVLLHMRLMAAARSDKLKAVVHIHNLQDDSRWGQTLIAHSQQQQKLLRLVTISCNDADGLLEYITKLLASGGSRVLDADVMLSTDGIVLVRCP